MERGHLTLIKPEEQPSRVYEVVVRRQLPCVPFWAPVTEVELKYLGLGSVVGRTRFMAKDLDTVESKLMDLTYLVPPGHFLDRTYLGAVDMVTGIEAPITMDLSETGAMR